MNGENRAKIYIIENKIVILSSLARFTGKKGGQKRRVGCLKSLKTNVEKMSAFRLSTMLMKTKELNQSFHDVDEKKMGY
jgi:hypothetical protein